MVFLGRSIAEHRNYSEAIARSIDAEVRQVISTAYSRALDVMSRHRDILDRLAESLVQKESLNEQQVDELLALASA